jgi:hypothetical protein
VGCLAVFCIVLDCFVLSWIVWWRSVLVSIGLYCFDLSRIILCCSVLSRIDLC